MSDKAEVIKSTLKSLISIIPYFGSALNEAIFEYRSNIKQNRINKFIEMLTEYFGKNIYKVNIDDLKTEYFVDLFESVISHVLKNSSIEKLAYYRNILINHIKHHFESDFSENYLEMLSTINENQLIILDTYHKAKIGEIESKDDLKRQGNYGNVPSKIESEYRKANNYNLSEFEYQKNVQMLVSKGLLADFSSVMVVSKPFELLLITELGIDFLDFIKLKQ
jgi:hypothetical protein